MAQPNDRLYPGVWGEFSSRLSPNFRVQWIKQCDTPLGKADHIKNPGDDTPVRRCRDGQELPSSVGETLCRFLWQQPQVDLLKGDDLPDLPKDHDELRRDAQAAQPAAAPLALEDA